MNSFYPSASSGSTSFIVTLRTLQNLVYGLEKFIWKKWSTSSISLPKTLTWFNSRDLPLQHPYKHHTEGCKISNKIETFDEFSSSNYSITSFDEFSFSKYFCTSYYNSDVLMALMSKRSTHFNLHCFLN